MDRRVWASAGGAATATATATASRVVFFMRSSRRGLSQARPLREGSRKNDRVSRSGSVGTLHVRFEGATDSRAGATELNPVRHVRQPQRLAGLSRAESVDVAKNEHLSLRRRECLERLVETVTGLFFEQEALRRLVVGTGPALDRVGASRLVPEVLACSVPRERQQS